MESFDCVKKNIKSILISSPNLLPIYKLETDYYNLLTRRPPYKELGYTSFVNMLYDMPDVIEIQKLYGQYYCKAVVKVEDAEYRVARLVSLNKKPRFSNNKIKANYRSYNYNNNSTLNHSKPNSIRVEENLNHQVITDSKIINKTNEESNKWQTSRFYDSKKLLEKNTFIQEKPTLNKQTISQLDDNIFSKEENVYDNEQVLDSNYSLSDIQSDNQKSETITKNAEDLNFTRLRGEIRTFMFLHPNGINLEELREIHYSNLNQEAISRFGFDSVKELLKNMSDIVNVIENKSNGDIKVMPNKIVAHVLNKDRNDLESIQGSKDFIENYILDIQKFLSNYTGVRESIFCELFERDMGYAFPINEMFCNSFIGVLEKYSNILVRKKASFFDDWLIYLTESEPVYMSDYHYRLKQIKHNNLDVFCYYFKLHINNKPEELNTNMLFEEMANILKLKICLEDIGYLHFENFLSYLKDYLNNAYHETDSDFLLPNESTISNSISSFMDDAVLYGSSYRPMLALPLNKLFTVRVAEVIYPSDFYIHLGEYEEIINRLMTQLQVCYNNKDIYNSYKLEDSKLALGMVCVGRYSVNGEWHRCLIIDVNFSYVELFFVDYGTIERHYDKSYSYCYLKYSFFELPMQAYKCRLANLKPINEFWTKEASVFFLNHVKGCKSSMRALNYNENVYSVELWTSKLKDCLNDLLPNNHFAKWEDDKKWPPKLLHREPLQLLTQLKCIRELNNQKFADLPALQVTDEIVSLQLADVTSPGLFWFQLAMNVPNIDRMMENLQLFYNNTNMSNWYLIRPELMHVGQSCIAIYPSVGNWHRCSILQITHSFLKMFYVDYGTIETLERSSYVYYPRPCFYELPQQAIKGKLSSIVPANENDWSDAATNFLISKVMEIKLSAKILQVDEEMVSIDLYADEECQTTLQDMMVKKGLARWKDSLHPHNINITSKESIPEVRSICNGDSENEENIKSQESSCFLYSSEDEIEDVNLELPASGKLTKHVQLPGKHSMTLICLGNKLYLVHSEVSAFFWNADNIRSYLRDANHDWKHNFNLTLFCEDHTELLTRLHKEIPILMKRNTPAEILVLYHLPMVVEILQVLNKENHDLKSAIIDQMNIYNPNAIYWTGIKEADNGRPVNCENSISSNQQIKDALLRKLKQASSAEFPELVKQLEALDYSENKLKDLNHRITNHTNAFSTPQRKIEPHVISRGNGQCLRMPTFNHLTSKPASSLSPPFTNSCNNSFNFSHNSSSPTTFNRTQLNKISPNNPFQPNKKTNLKTPPKN